MSTTYYALRHPVARVERLYAPGAPYAALNAYGRRVATVDHYCLHLLANRDEKVAHRSGDRIAVYATGPDDAQAISDYGELVTLGELRRGVAP